MRRLQRPSEDHQRDRWLVSYADFITLLFAFFVVMYSISSVNEGKYKVLSETLEGVFNTRQKALEPIQVGDVSARGEQPKTDNINLEPFVRDNEFGSDGRGAETKDPSLESIAGEFEDSFADLIYQESLSVRILDDWVEISLRDDVVFERGGVLPSETAFPVIQKIANVLRDRPNGILIEGHTDNLRIATDQFPSNWELSAARAATFLRLLGVEGIDESRMAAAGFGQYKPVVRNDTPLGRAKNRRVVLLVSKQANIRESILE
jgi:chemotaxis protein MotB